jgi:hypothetical protein
VESEELPSPHHVVGVPCDGRDTPDPFADLALVYGPLLLHVRPARRLQQAVVRHLAARNAPLAAQLQALSPEQFEQVCERLKARLA